MTRINITLGQEITTDVDNVSVIVLFWLISGRSRFPRRAASNTAVHAACCFDERNAEYNNWHHEPGDTAKSYRER
jgi:hypothetical protein